MIKSIYHFFCMVNVYQAHTMVHIRLTFYFDGTPTTGYSYDILFTPALSITDGRDREMYTEEDM